MSMRDTVISARNVAKRYRLGLARRHDTIRDRIAGGVGDMVRRLSSGSTSAEQPEDLWALQDVSFDVREGEILGVIGRNGAGKSTLLKILSQITEPTGGEIVIRGRLSSLLEVGTGFHPELTGRENIFMNGAILGMSRLEIRKKFDEIVAFAEVERFIDTPVKRYSSGMYVRLAFAVAAHLEPEILLVDEVLAVGDAEFQKKCLGKMRHDVERGGRTVLFVSHNMTAIRALCGRVLLLQDGRVIEDGPPAKIVSRYLDAGFVSPAERSWTDPALAPRDGFVRWRRVRVLDEGGEPSAEVDIQRPFDVEIEYYNLAEGAKLGASIVLTNSEGVTVFSSISNRDPEWHAKPRSKGLFRSVCRVPGNLLADGRYGISILTWADNYQSILREEGILEVVVNDTGGVRGDYYDRIAGVVRPLLTWKTERLDDLDSDPSWAGPK